MTPLWPSEVEHRLRESARNLDSQQVPSEVRFCKRCVTSNQRPRIRFNADGVCSACEFAEHKNEIDWEARRDELSALLDRHRRPTGYDVIVPCSGGKDSATVAHRLKHEWGMNPLCTMFAPFMYTDIGRRNLDSFIQSGFDVQVFHPNGLLHRKLARLAFEYIGDPFLPFVYGQLAYPMQTALRLGIPLVMYGENGEAEYGGDPAANNKPCWDQADWERVYMKGAGIGRLIDIGYEVGALSADDETSLSGYYRPPARGELIGRGVEFHWFSYYRRWHPQENFYYACEHTGFEPNEERSEGTYSKYASLDDKLDGLHYYMAYAKFGLGRCTSDAAHEVRDGDIDREEAVALVRQYDGEFPTRYLDDCLEYLGMDEAHLQTVIDRFRPAHLWHGDVLRHTVWNAEAASDRAA